MTFALTGADGIQQENKMNILDGKKTYIAAVFVAVAAALPVLGYPEYSELVMKLGGALGIVGIGHKLSK